MQDARSRGRGQELAPGWIASSLTSAAAVCTLVACGVDGDEAQSL